MKVARYKGYISIYIVFFKRQNYREKNQLAIAKVKNQERGLTVKGQELFGVMEMFYILIMVVITHPYTFVETYQSVLKGVNFIFISYTFISLTFKNIIKVIKK